MKKATFIVLSLVLLLGISYGQENRSQIYVFFGVNHVFSYGSEDDYVIGENDFPVTPAHTPLDLGAAFSFPLAENWSLELRGNYTFGSKVTLQDPSDQDTVDVNTSEHFAIGLNLHYLFLEGKFRPYIMLGGGIDILLAEDESYISDYGFEVEFLAPDNATDFFANVGAGIQYGLADSIGLKVEARYILLFGESENTNSLNAAAGIFFRF